MLIENIFILLVKDRIDISRALYQKMRNVSTCQWKCVTRMFGNIMITWHTSQCACCERIQNETGSKKPNKTQPSSKLNTPRFFEAR